MKAISPILSGFGVRRELMGSPASDAIKHTPTAANFPDIPSIAAKPGKFLLMSKAQRRQVVRRITSQKRWRDELYQALNSFFQQNNTNPNYLQVARVFGLRNIPYGGLQPEERTNSRVWNVRDSIR